MLHLFTTFYPRTSGRIRLSPAGERVHTAHRVHPGKEFAKYGVRAVEVWRWRHHH